MNNTKICRIFAICDTFYTIMIFYTYYNNNISLGAEYVIVYKYINSVILIDGSQMYKIAANFVAIYIIIKPNYIILCQLPLAKRGTP